MKPRLSTTLGLLVTLALVLPAWGAGTVTINLSSGQDGKSVPPGATIDWTITADVSGGDNFGLALLAVDLVQDPANPELFDLPSPGAVPGGMENFYLPDGVSNPPAGSGLNLLQIGGGQNNTGVVVSDEVGASANVVPGVGQSGTQIIASGSFTAPSTEGAYVFSIENAIANVLDQVNTPPNFSPVSQATVVLGSSSISPIICEGKEPCTTCPADFDGSGAVGPFDLALLLGAWGPCDACPEDLDGNGEVGPFDLALLLGNWGPCE